MYFSDLVLEKSCPRIATDAEGFVDRFRFLLLFRSSSFLTYSEKLSVDTHLKPTGPCRPSQEIPFPEAPTSKLDPTPSKSTVGGDHPKSVCSRGPLILETERRYCSAENGILSNRIFSPNVTDNFYIFLVFTEKWLPNRLPNIGNVTGNAGNIGNVTSNIGNISVTFPVTLVTLPVILVTCYQCYW